MRKQSRSTKVRYCYHKGQNTTFGLFVQHFFSFFFLAEWAFCATEKKENSPSQPKTAVVLIKDKIHLMEVFVSIIKFD